MIDVDPLEGLSSIVVSRLCSREEYAEAVGRKKDVSNEISGPSGKAMDCTEGEARKIDDSYVSSVSAAHRDSWIMGLEGTRRDGVMVLGVDSVTDVDVVGNSGVPIREGPGKDGGTADTGRGGASRSERNSVGRTEGLPGNGTSLAIPVVETDELSMSEGERVVERSSEVGDSGRICTSPTAGAGGMTWTTSPPGGGINPSTGWVITRATGSGSTTWIPSETTFSGLQRHSASSYSVDTSVGHTSAVVNGDVGSLSQTGAVI